MNREQDLEKRILELQKELKKTKDELQLLQRRIPQWHNIDDLPKTKRYIYNEVWSNIVIGVSSSAQSISLYKEVFYDFNKRQWRCLDGCSTLETKIQAWCEPFQYLYTL